MVFDLLATAGFMPAFDRCGLCERTMAHEPVVYVSPSRGGTICRHCEKHVPDRLRIDPRLLGIANLVMELPRSEDGQALRLPRLGRAQVDPLHAILARDLMHNTDRPYRLPAWVIGRRKAVSSRPITGPVMQPHEATKHLGVDTPS